MNTVEIPPESSQQRPTQKNIQKDTMCSMDVVDTHKQQFSMLDCMVEIGPWDRRWISYVVVLGERYDHIMTLLVGITIN